MDFKHLPSEPFTLRNVSIPACLVDAQAGLVLTDIGIAEGVFCEPAGVDVDMSGAMVLPAFVDMHTHLDKGHTLPRASNPDGSFIGALNAVREDHAHWTATDVYRRADFALRCAYAHGTRAIRTHIDSAAPQDLISWSALAELRAAWAGRIDIQGVCLNVCDDIDLDGRFQTTADLVRQNDGVLGLVPYPMHGLDSLLRDFLSLAARLDLDVDMHVDETMDPTVESLRNVCQAVIDIGFDRTVTVGHVCSLSAQKYDRAMDTLDLVARAGVHVVSLPMCNMYLQDRQDSRTPRRRGVTLVHEMKQRGIPVSFASDNTRDPFYAYGDLDMIEVVQQATRIAHLDHSDEDWFRAFSSVPAATCGFTPVSFANGAPADLIVCRSRNWGEFHARPQSDRIVIRNGQVIDRTLPDYAELDDLFES
ncbi:MAG: cytosine deaminase [Granulosicoccus sp.]